MMIDVSHLKKRYKDLYAVNDFNLQVAEGEIFGLLGPNGAGKSTSMLAMLGLLKIDGGSVRIMGEDIQRHAHKVKPYIGYVPQENAFFDSLPARDNVSYWARIYGLHGRDMEQSVQTVLELTGLSERRRDIPKHYSGGMKRRLNIACGIVHRPKLLFMDEPTAGVDPQSRNQILETVQRLRDEGTTVLYTSHYMEEIEAICGRVSIMDHGRVIASGQVQDLIDSYLHEYYYHIRLSAPSPDFEKGLRGVPGVRSVRSEGGVLEVITEKMPDILTRITQYLVNSGAPMEQIISRQPNLETVFLHLTGKTLRD